MNISTKTRYGFRLLVYLGLNQNEDKSIQLGEIAKKEDISLKYLEKIVQMLKRGGLVTVKRGPKGGYRLGKESSLINLYEVYENLEGSCSIVECLDTDSCDRSDNCSTINLWKGLSDVIKNYLTSRTLEDIIKENQLNNPMFYI